MKRVMIVAVLACFAFLLFGSKTLLAGEMDILLSKLVEKGVLTPGEAQQIKTETQEQVKKEIAQGKYSNLPQWLQTMKLKGDFRLRYQNDHSKSSSINQSRGRIRLRLGLESKVNEKLIVGVGLATGKTGDPRSTNQTFTDSFDKKPFILDYAYAQYSPVRWAALTGGKMKNPLWEPGDLIWDTDITPEGGALQLNKKIGSNTEAFLNAGVFVIDEQSSSDHDPVLYAIQPGIKYMLSDSVGIKGAVSYYNFSNIKGNALEYGSGTNSKMPGSTTLYRYDYFNVNPAVEVGIKEPFKALGVNVPYLALFGEYVNNINSAVKKDNTGYMLGFKFGVEKVEKFGDWQFKYNYALLGRDAVPDILPDSDRYSGKTGMKAHEGVLDFGLGKNTWLGLDYYYGEQLKGNFGQSQSRPASVVQVDWNMKF